MENYLIVKRPFLSYQRGDLITDTVNVSKILSSEYKSSIIKISLPSRLKG